MSKRIGKVPEWLKFERAARRTVELENGGPKSGRGGAHKLRNKPGRKQTPNTVRRIDDNGY